MKDAKVNAGLESRLLHALNRHTLYAKMIEEVQDYAIILLDNNGIIQNWNKGAEKIKQYTESEAVGMSFKEFYLAEDRANRLPEKLLNEAATNGRVFHEGWRLKKDGSRFWGSVTLTALHDDDDNIIGYTKLTRDLTERKLAEDQDRQLSRELKESNEELKKSEQDYHRMIAEVEDYAIILMDEKGTIRSWNAGAQKIKGYNLDEIIGENFRRFYLPADQANKLPEQLLEKATEAGSVTHEGWRVRKNGSTFWGSVVITALHGENGQLIGFSKVTRDLTDRKIREDQLIQITEELQKSNEALRKSEERYHKMIGEVQDYAIILLDESGNIVNWNTGAEKIKGYTASEIIGKNFRLFYLPEDQQRGLPETLLNEAIENGKANHEGWRVRKDNTRFWGSIVITSLHGENNEIIGFSKVTRDLTQRKEAEDKLAAYLGELERQNRELEQFAYVASHDLQEPLRKIRTFVEVIQNNMHNQPTVDRYFRKISTSAERMTEQIRGILTYSRMSKAADRMIETDINKILSEILIDFELLISEKKAVIKTVTIPKVTADAVQIQQLFYNLIGNALKFSTEDPVIEISSQTVNSRDLKELAPGDENKNYLQIKVSDNGIGFEKQYSEKIFDLFQRLHAKDDYAGTGIGLAICKKIMDNHKGFIKATGELGKGATFYLYFPI